MNWLLFSADDRDEVRALNDESAALEPRLVDNPEHEHFGKWALPATVIEAEGFERWRAMLEGLEAITANPIDLFAPEDEYS